MNCFSLYFFGINLLICVKSFTYESLFLILSSSNGYKIFVSFIGGHGAPNLHFFVFFTFFIHDLECLWICNSIDLLLSLFVIF